MDEILQRAVNGYCPSGYCGDSDGYYGNYTLDMLRQQTTWYRLVEHGVDMSTLPELMHAFMHDAECNYNFYASQHLVTQATFVNQVRRLDLRLPLDEPSSNEPTSNPKL